MRCIIIMLSAFCVLSLTTVSAQNKWELKKSENGIEVYTRNSGTGKLKELRVLCELDATKEQLIKTIFNIAGYSNWVYASRKAQVLKVVSPQKLLYYTQTSLPWPLKDRDLIIELAVDNVNPELVIEARDLPGYLPLNDKFIRVPFSLATWHVNEPAPNKLKVEYTFSVDPGGSVPLWLVNATIVIGPYNSFVKLREVLNKMKTQPLKH